MGKIKSWISLLFLLGASIATTASAQTFTTLASFQGTNGAFPGGAGPLVQGTDGNFYGVAQTYGSEPVYGILFKMTPSGTLTTFYAFCSQPKCADGTGATTLIQATDGNFYGTGGGGPTSSNCPVGCGTVFKITPGGTFTTLHSFDFADGSGPYGLLQAADGNFYGTTLSGGSGQCSTGQANNGCGTIFKIAPDGTFTTLYNFGGYPTDGSDPAATLVQGTDGNLYDTTQWGSNISGVCVNEDGENGFSGCGTIFKITTGGEYTLLHSLVYSEGANPNGLVQGSDGNFYGTAQYGGVDNYGTAFQVTPAGTLTTLYNFCSQANCADGSRPQIAALIQATDGYFYGTTSYGGEFCQNYGDGPCGTIFRISSAGILTTLHSFCSQANCADGAFPDATLLQAANGNLYGTTNGGGVTSSGSGYGTVFSQSLVPLEASSTTLTSSLNPSSYGQAVTFTATVTSQSSGTPTGTVNFLDGSTKIGSATLNGSGVATFVTSVLSGGTHSITAAYSGDATFAPSTSSVLTQVVQGPTAVLSPTSLSLSSPAIGTPSPPQNVTLTNTGNAALTVSSIGITGANASEFGETNNCPGSVPANGSCTIAVTFTPSAAGIATASLSVSDTAPGSPQSASLTGIIGTSAIVNLSSASFTFPSQYVGTSGLPQTLTVTNVGNAALTITSLTSSVADFGTLSNCGNPVQPGANCAIGIFFDPTASGTRNGTLTITDNAAGSPQTVALSGMGQDFSLSASSSSATVMPGQTANYTVAIAPGGGFSQTVALSCSGAPAQSTCTLSENSVALNGSKSASVTVTVTTAGTSARLSHPAGFAVSANKFALWLGLWGLPGLVLIGGQHRRSLQRRAWLLRRVALLCFLSVAMTWSACGGGNSSSNGGNGGGGTPAGTYNLTVTGSFASGSTTLTRNAKLTLIVQ